MIPLLVLAWALGALALLLLGPLLGFTPQSTTFILQTFTLLIASGSVVHLALKWARPEVT
ncbi:MAG: hypothetical protein ACE5LS_00785 [Thermoplasmata archaeon]